MAEIRRQALTINQIRVDGGLDQICRGEGNKKWTDSGCGPDSGPLGFADGLDIGFERMCSYRGLAQAARKMKQSLTKLRRALRGAGNGDNQEFSFGPVRLRWYFDIQIE